MIWVTRTHVGLVRLLNEDTVFADTPLYGVADGMGGHNAGEVASRLAADRMMERLHGKEPSQELLKAALIDVNRAVFSEQVSHQEYSGMGTTLTVLWEGETNVYLGHIGDSRAYLLRDGSLSQVTRDHSLVQEMVSQGLITREEALVHPYRNVITRAVGTDPYVESDCLTLEKSKGDIWLLCSDGLSNFVSDEVIERTLKEQALDPAADTLLQTALQNGGRDNISLLIAEVS